jgi:hypothetical protein
MVLGDLSPVFSGLLDFRVLDPFLLEDAHSRVIENVVVSVVVAHII